MPRFNPWEMTDEALETLIQWIYDEGLVPGEIAADGRFSVHNGRVSGNKYLRNADGAIVFGRWSPVTEHFNVPQKNPLPEALA